jgi:hypothetical protein
MIFLCGQDEILMGECLCGDDYNRFIPGGVVGPHGWRYCAQECTDEQLDREATEHADFHRGIRDLLCNCAEFCAPAGLPTAAMLQEYADYVASIKGTALDPGAGPQRVIE